MPIVTKKTKVVKVQPEKIEQPDATVVDFMDFSEVQDKYPLIPDNTMARVSIFIQPGGENVPGSGMADGFATLAKTGSGALYLACECSVEFPTNFNGKIFENIGLYSKNGDAYANKGRKTICAILNSSRGMHPDNTSDRAKAARRITSFADLSGLEFAACIEIEKCSDGIARNKIKEILQPGHPEYDEIMGAGIFKHTTKNTSSPATVPVTLNRPDWAKGGF